MQFENCVGNRSKQSPRVNRIEEVNHQRTITAASVPASSRTAGLTLQRKCDCGQHTIGGGKCSGCTQAEPKILQRVVATDHVGGGDGPPIVNRVLRSAGQSLDADTRSFMETSFGHDFSHVRIHTDQQASESARAVNALAYTVGRDVAFRSGTYAPGTSEGRRLIAHELAHVVQQSAASVETTQAYPSDSSAFENNADQIADRVVSGGQIPPVLGAASAIQRRAAPYIKKVTVHLAPPQSADLEWEGTAPSTATGSDHFTVSTGKGYSDPGDPAGTCTRTCCTDAMTQCAPPWNQPTRVGACCTYYGDSFWTGTPLEEHNTWKWWTPIQPYYSSRGIALHQHPDVTGDPIGHGCVRMADGNAKRIFDFSNGRRTNVTVDGRAAPVACSASQQCSGTGGSSTGATGTATGAGSTAMAEPIPGQEGELS